MCVFIPPPRSSIPISIYLCLIMSSSRLWCLRAKGIVHHMVFVKVVMEGLHKRVRARYGGQPFWSAFMNASVHTLRTNSHAMGSAGSEFELYLSYAIGYWPETVSVLFSSFHRSLPEIIPLFPFHFYRYKEGSSCGRMVRPLLVDTTATTQISTLTVTRSLCSVLLASKDISFGE